MSSKKLTYQDFSLKNDPLATRFFVCSAFEIYYKSQVEDNRVKVFNFLNIGSYFLSKLLEDLASKLENVEIEKAPLIIEETKNLTNKHSCLTATDKRRFINFLNRLKVL
jgi:hypothetical protein